MHGNLQIMEETMPVAHVAHLPADGAAWCVLALWSGQEWNVQREITQFPTYMPLETRIVVIRGRKLKKVRPLILGYLFVQIDLADDGWGSLGKESLKGSMGLLKNNDKPVRVPDMVIDRIRTAESAGVFDYTGRSPFQVGDAVEITEGPCAGLIGKIRSAMPRKRAKLFLDALGEAEIDTSYLRKL